MLELDRYDIESSSERKHSGIPMISMDSVLTADEFNAKKRELFKGSKSSEKSSHSPNQMIIRSNLNNYYPDNQHTVTRITDMDTQASESDTEDTPPLISIDVATGSEDVSIKDSDIQCIVEMMGGSIGREEARRALENNFGENYLSLLLVLLLLFLLFIMLIIMLIITYINIAYTMQPFVCN